MSKATRVHADQLMSVSELFTMGAVSIIVTLVVGFVLALPAGSVLLNIFDGTAIGVFIQAVGPVLVVFGVPSFLIWRDRFRIATTRRALWMGLGTASGLMVAGGLPTCATALSAGHFLESALFMIVFSFAGFVWPMICWPLVRLRMGAVQIVTDGYCYECNYSLTGNQSGVCPECGTAILQNARAESANPVP